ncbi:MAG: hypothetical protein P1U63_09545 [Coxiellaceae bacterium]|nr:hypothetical protein [Coxiellaceae bacterium]
MEGLGNFDPNLLTVYERRILWFCTEKRARTDIVRRTRNYSAGKRSIMLKKLKKLHFLESFKHENFDDKRLTRPVEYWIITDLGKQYIQQFEQWFNQLPKPDSGGS